MGQDFSNSLRIYVFRCGTTALYALTSDRTGRNLPTLGCQTDWQFERSMTLTLGGLKDELTKATMAAITKLGFYLTHSAIHGLPISSILVQVTEPGERSKVDQTLELS